MYGTHAKLGRKIGQVPFAYPLWGQLKHQELNLNPHKGEVLFTPGDGT